MSILLLLSGGGVGVVDTPVSVLSPSGMPLITVEAQLEDGVWTDLTDDVAAELEWRYGIQGNGPLDRMAGTGDLRFNLFNDAKNSGETTGWYSPAHASKRTGWDFDKPVRVVVTPGPTRGVTTMSLLGSTVTVQTASAHGLSTGDYVTISGADQAVFNGTHEVTVTGLNTFTFEVTV